LQMSPSLRPGLDFTYRSYAASQVLCPGIPTPSLPPPPPPLPPTHPRPAPSSLITRVVICYFSQGLSAFADACAVLPHTDAPVLMVFGMHGNDECGLNVSNRSGRGGWMLPINLVRDWAERLRDCGTGPITFLLLACVGFKGLEGWSDELASIGANIGRDLNVIASRKDLPFLFKEVVVAVTTAWVRHGVGRNLANGLRAEVIFGEFRTPR
jgi:hypothetical protein